MEAALGARVQGDLVLPRYLKSCSFGIEPLPALGFGRSSECARHLAGHCPVALRWRGRVLRGALASPLRRRSGNHWALLGFRETGASRAVLGGALAPLAVPVRRGSLVGSNLQEFSADLISSIWKRFPPTTLHAPFPACAGGLTPRVAGSRGILFLFTDPRVSLRAVCRLPATGLQGRVQAWLLSVPLWRERSP